MTYVTNGVPASGYFPFWIGIAVVGLALLHVAMTWSQPVIEDDPGNREWRKPALVAVGLIVCVAVLDYAGLGVAVGLYLLFLLAYLERVPLLIAVPTAVGITGVVVVLFGTVLGVPIPRGPWGF